MKNSKAQWQSIQKSPESTTVLEKSEEHTRFIQAILVALSFTHHSQCDIHPSVLPIPNYSFHYMWEPPVVGCLVLSVLEARLYSLDRVECAQKQLEAWCFPVSFGPTKARSRAFSPAKCRDAAAAASTNGAPVWGSRSAT